MFDQLANSLVLIFLLVVVLFIIIIGLVYFLGQRTEKRWMRSVVRHELATKHRCPYCGAFITQNGKYCLQCGKRLH